MRVALVADVFPPMHSSGAVQLRDLAIEFAHQGYQITAIVAEPQLKNSWALENMNGVEVLRLRTPKTRDRSYIARTLGEFFMSYLMLWGLRQSPLASQKFDVIIWYSPTIFLGPLIKSLKKKSKCSTYLIIRDIFPEWAWEMNLIPSKVIYQYFKRVANYQYAQADVIGIQTSGNEIYFSSWKEKFPATRIEVLHNWLSDAPDVGCSIQISQSKLAGRKIFVYAGNMGVAQNTEVFCKLAVRLKHRGDLGFLFVGRGSEKSKLFNLYGDLPNILFCDEIPAEEIPGLFTQCQLGLIALDSRHRSHNIPGKFLSYMQSGLPVLACINPGNDLIKLITDYDVGIVVEDCADGSIDLGALQALALAEAVETKNYCRIIANEMFSTKNAVKQIVSSLAEKTKNRS